MGRGTRCRRTSRCSSLRPGAERHEQPDAHANVIDAPGSPISLALAELDEQRDDSSFPVSMFRVQRRVRQEGTHCKTRRHPLHWVTADLPCNAFPRQDERNDRRGR